MSRYVSATPETNLNDLRNIQREALSLLVEADALGRFPTPIEDLVVVANVEVADEDLDDGFLSRARAKALKIGGALLKRALSKVLGVFDVGGRIIHISRGVHASQKPFLTLHEVGHARLPWQRGAYQLIEDCEQTLAPEMSEQFDAEANHFASEALFQLDRFQKEAADEEFGVKVPLKLARRFGSSAYSAIRRYIRTHHLPCAVVVLDCPLTYSPSLGYCGTVRRIEVSPTFRKIFGQFSQSPVQASTGLLGPAIPKGKQKMTSPTPVEIMDRNGDSWVCTVEGFTQGFQVFILIHAISLR